MCMGHELHVANKNRWILYVYQEKDTFMYQSTKEGSAGGGVTSSFFLSSFIYPVQKRSRYDIVKREAVTGTGNNALYRSKTMTGIGGTPKKKTVQNYIICTGFPNNF